MLPCRTKNEANALLEARRRSGRKLDADLALAGDRGRDLEA
jgi:hypothetical protein